jgi:nucleotide-binding universal stress UspA family protein
MMVKKIMVPIAFSPYSRGILDYAADLAAAVGAELVVVNVIDDRDLEAVNKITSFGYKVDSDKYIETVKKERREGIKEMAEHLTLPDERLTFSFLIGDPSDELLRYVVESDIDMVVMGIRSRDIKHMFSGSVAERLFRRCPVPIVSYRGGDIAKRLRKRIEKHMDHH